MSETTVVRERPILFSAPMVLALLSGTKSQTRRTIKPQPPHDGRWLPKEHSESPGVWIGYSPEGRLRNDVVGGRANTCEWRCPYGTVGDLLWCREAFSAPLPLDIECKNFTGFFRATDAHRKVKWKPSIHMPRWASRLTLRITGVRVERLHAISEEDAEAEGVAASANYSAQQHFARLWGEINGPDSWAHSPWVWVLSFERVTPEPKS